MATTTNNYKQTSHLPRIVYTEAAPLSGMNYTNVPLASGYAKIVYNLVENPDSTGLRSRPGAVKVNDAIDLPTEVLTTELQYNETDNTFAMKNYFRGKLTGTIIAVESEYGRIYHYLYYSKDYIEGKGPLELLYTNELPLEIRPYKLDDQILYNTVPVGTNSNIVARYNEEKNQQRIYTATPVINDSGDFVATKAFETNDIMLLCSQKKYNLDTSELPYPDSAEIWYLQNQVITNLNSIPRLDYHKKFDYKFLNNTGVYDHIKYGDTPYKISDYADATIEKIYRTLDNVPKTLTYYKRVSITPNNANSYVVGFTTSENITYFTNYIISEEDKKFDDIFTAEIGTNNPVCLYKLPSKPCNNKYTYSIFKTTNQPIYTVKITDIKLTKDETTSETVSSYTVETSLGFKKNYEQTKNPVISEGFYNILSLIDNKNIPIGSFKYNITLSQNNTELNIDDTITGIVPLEEREKFNNLQYNNIVGRDDINSYNNGVDIYARSKKYKYTEVEISETNCNLDLTWLYDGYNTDFIDNIKTYPDVTYNFYFTDLSNAPQKIMPKQPTVNEALKYGYNMLLADPYNFTGTKSSDTADTIHFGGLLTYDDNNEIVLNPIMNRTYMFKLVTDTTSSTTPACVIIDYKTTAQDVWNHIYDDCNSGLILSDYANDVKFSWQPGVPNALVRVRYYAQTDKELQVNPETNLAFENLAALTAYLSTDTTGKYDKNIFAVKSYSTTVYYRAKFADNVYTTALEYYPEAGDTTEDTLFKQGYRNLRTVPIAMSFERNYETNVSVRNYDFSTAQGMCYWFNRLVVWGVDGGANVLFLSDINDPSYFPYPNNISVFDETVIKALPFQDSLLVFTTTKIWRVDLAEDGMSWYESCIQKNLRIEPKEAHLIEALTTMVFFKSGYLYYLLTPSSKGTGELVIANISKPVIDILQNPDKFFESMESAVYAHYYSNDNKLKLEEHNVYVDSSEIHIVYSYSGTYFDDAKVIDATANTPSINTLRNYILSYNTNTRKWRVWSFDSDQVPRVLYKDAVGGLVWYTISSRIKDLVKNITDDTPTTYTLQNKLYTFQFLLNDINNADIYDEGVPGGHRAYQYLDTGNREIRKEYYKKFREYQVVFNNRSDNDLQFDVQFCIDDNVIIPLFDGTVTAEADDSLYGSTEQTVFGTVKTLDTSLVFTINKTMWDKFHTVKCKVPVASKGYAPALRILSKNRHSYDLLNITWVYRLKNAR